MPLSLRLLAIVKSGLVRHLSSQVKTLLKDIEQLIGKLNTFCTRAAALRVSFPLWGRHPPARCTCLDQHVSRTGGLCTGGLCTGPQADSRVSCVRALATATDVRAGERHATHSEGQQLRLPRSSILDLDEDDAFPMMLEELAVMDSPTFIEAVCYTPDTAAPEGGGGAHARSFHYPPR